MYTGACLCGAVQFEIHGSIRNIIYCHCSQCRKAQGSAFATNGIVHKDHFKFSQGESELTAYTASEHQTKYFCKHCGSPIMSQSTNRPDDVRVRLGTIESDIRERPEAHIFITSRANWENVCENLPEYEQHEPNR